MTVWVGSTICLSPASVGIQWSPAFSRSAPVTTARTPGIFNASDASMPRILAWAYGLRTMSIQSWPGRLRSSMYSPLPRMKRGSSLRLTEWPMPPTSRVVVVRTWTSVISLTPRSPAPPAPSPRRAALPVDGDADVDRAHRPLLAVRLGALGGEAQGPFGHHADHGQLVVDRAVAVLGRSSLAGRGEAGLAELLGARK